MWLSGRRFLSSERAANGPSVEAPGHRHGETEAGEILVLALGLAAGDHPPRTRQACGDAHADGDGLAVSDLVVPEHALERVADRVPVVEQAPHAVVALVRLDDARLHRRGPRQGVGPRTGGRGPPAAQPLEQLRVGDAGGLVDLGQPATRSRSGRVAR